MHASDRCGIGAFERVSTCAYIDDNRHPASSPSGDARGVGLANASAALVLAAYSLLRLLLATSMRINSDEPQHAHVAWAWSQGLVPYRDTFDNHVPLFHMLYAPVLGLVGPTPNILLWLRLAILPIAVASMGLTLLIARKLWNRNVAFSAILVLAACPPYLYVAGEFRTDVLWGAAWLATLAIATLGRWSPWRAFWLGLAIGVAFAISLKTLILVVGAVIAATTVYVSLPTRDRPSLRTVATSLVAILLGAIVVPGLVLGTVAADGGLVAMRYDVLEHNLLPGLASAIDHPTWRALTIIGLLALPATNGLARPAGVATSLQARRTFIIVSALASVIVLLGTWPLLTRQDCLPIAPLLAIGIAAWWDQRRAMGAGAWLLPALAAAGVASVFVSHDPMQDRTGHFRAALAQVLAITADGEPVMDDKGAAIFRRRPFYFALETLTLRRMARGLIVDDIPRRLVATDTHVVWARRLPVRDRMFVAQHYVPAGNGLQVAGCDFGYLKGGDSATVRILFPGSYALLGSDAAAARIDGTAYGSARALGAGSHALTVRQPGHYLLVWRPAIALFERPAKA